MSIEGQGHFLTQMQFFVLFHILVFWVKCCTFTSKPSRISRVTAVAGVGSSPTRVTCGTSQVLLAGVSGGFPGVLPFRPTYWSSRYEWNNLERDVKLNKKKRKKRCNSCVFTGFKKDLKRNETILTFFTKILSRSAQWSSCFALTFSCEREAGWNINKACEFVMNEKNNTFISCVFNGFKYNIMGSLSGAILRHLRIFSMKIAWKYL